MGNKILKNFFNYKTDIPRQLYCAKQQIKEARGIYN